MSLTIIVLIDSVAKVVSCNSYWLYVTTQCYFDNGGSARSVFVNQWLKLSEF